MICIALIEGCPGCEKENWFLESIGHECGQSTQRYSTLCEISRKARRRSEEFHRLVHEPLRCEDCGAVLNDHLGNVREKVRMCRAGCCHEWYCPDCGVTQSSDGPVECPACGSLGSVAKNRLRKMHAMYGARRRMTRSTRR